MQFYFHFSEKSKNRGRPGQKLFINGLKIFLLVPQEAALAHLEASKSVSKCQLNRHVSSLGSLSKILEVRN